jgi:hypothetical protein
MNIESGSREPDNSQVFLVRLWTGEVANLDEVTSVASDGTRVQGKVTHLLSGKGSSFGDAATLVSLLLGMLSTTPNNPNREEEKGAQP